MLSPEESVSPDLSDQLDSALQALWQGDSSQLELLLDSDEVTVPLAGELLRGVFGAEAVPAVPRLSEGDIPGHRIGEAIGRGGMGIVFKAWHEELDQDRAVKLMLMGPLVSKASQERFRHEARLAARLRHPNIVSVLDSEELPSGQRYYVMEYVEGVNLSRYLRESKPEVPSILSLFLQVCDAIEHVHRKGIIHRDLKPGNVIVDRQGKPFVLDFGVAKATDYAASEEVLSAYFSLPDEAAGTLPYLSPEQAAGKHDEVDERTDVHALGVMLYEALTGKRPYDTTGPRSEALRRIAEVSPSPPSLISDRVDAGLQKIVLTALEKDRDHRYQSAADLARDVRAYLAGDPIVRFRESPPYFLRKKVKKHRRVRDWAAVGVVVVLLGLLGGIWRERQERANARLTATWVQYDVESGRTKRAFEGAASLYSGHPDLPEAVLVSAQAGFARGRVIGDNDLVSEALGTLRVEGQSDGSKWAYRALLAEMEDTVSGRLREKTRAAMEAPDTAEAWYVRTYATLDAEKALCWAEQALDRDPGKFLTRLIWTRLAHLYLLTREYDDAAVAAQTLVDMSGEALKWGRFEMRVRITQGEYGEARRLGKGLVVRFPGPDTVLRYWALACLCDEDYAEAGELYLRAWDEGSGSDWELYRLALCQWLAGDVEAAEESYRQFWDCRSHSFGAGLRLYVLKRDEATFADEEGRIDDAESARQEADGLLEDTGNLAKDDQWRQKIVDCFAEKLDPQDLVDIAVNRRNVEDLCEATYYAGEVCRLRHEAEDARRFFQACVDTNLRFDPNSTGFDPMSEYHLARWRLAHIPHPEGAKSLPSGG